MHALINWPLTLSRRLWKTAGMWWRHKHADEAAALAFYSLFSLIPIVLIGVTVASFIVDETLAKEILMQETNKMAGHSVSAYIAQILTSNIHWIGSGISPWLGGLLLIYSATKVIAELRKSLGKVFGKPEHKGKQAAIAGLRGRLASLVLLLILGGFIASAVIFEAMVSLIINKLDHTPWLLGLISYASPLFSLGAVVLLTAVTMRWLPQRPPKFKEALYAGCVNATLLLFLKIALTTFLKHANVGDLYGGALTLVLVLFWIYFAMQAFLFSAEFAAELVIERRNQRK